MTVDHKPDFETVKLQFITDSESGKAPTLQDYAQRYPQFSDELVEFVMSYATMNNGAKRVHEAPSASDSTLRIIEETVAATSAAAIPVDAKNLTEARQKMGWSFGQLAQQLNLDKELVLRLVRGYEEWPPKLEQKVAKLFNLTRTQAALLLRNTVPIPATQFKATDQQQTKPVKSKSFQEDLEEFARQGKLTPEQRREWLGEEN